MSPIDGRSGRPGLESRQSGRPRCTWPGWVRRPVGRSLDIGTRRNQSDDDRRLAAGGRRPRDTHQSRAQSATLGLVLVFGLVIIGATVVVVLGGAAFDDSSSALGTQRAEKAMTQFDSRAALVALGNTHAQQLQIPLRSGDRLGVNETAGSMTVSIKSFSGGPDRSESWELGRLTYTNGETDIAYQGGGVWRKATGESGSLMVSPPEFHFRNGTLTLPAITVSGDSSVGRRVNVTPGSATTTWFPDSSGGWLNPLDDHRVFVNVTSEYYHGWGQYFEKRTEGDVRYDHANSEVSLELVTPIGTRTVRDAVASLAPTGTFRISGRAGNPCGGSSPYADSYNSSGTDDGYCGQTPGSNGNITYGDNVDISRGAGTSNIHGDVRSGGSVEVSNSKGKGQPSVDGDIYYTTTCDGRCSGRSTGTVNKISGIKTVSPIDRRVESVVSELSTGNDNGATGAIAGDQLVFDEGAGDADGPDTATLSAGDYYLDAIDFSGGDTLNVDTSSGPVRIAVRYYVDVGGGDEISVSGDGIARFYVVGESPLSAGGGDQMLRVNGNVNVEDDDAPELRVYGKRNFNTTIDGGEFTGVIYAPPGSSGTSSLDVGHGALFGGAVVADTEIRTQGSIHYDEALQGKQIVSPNAKVVKITYLHVSVDEINVGGG